MPFAAAVQLVFWSVFPSRMGLCLSIFISTHKCDCDDIFSVAHFSRFASSAGSTFPLKKNSMAASVYTISKMFVLHFILLLDLFLLLPFFLFLSLKRCSCFASSKLWIARVMYAFEMCLLKKKNYARLEYNKCARVKIGTKRNEKITNRDEKRMIETKTHLSPFGRI